MATLKCKSLNKAEEITTKEDKADKADKADREAKEAKEVKVITKTTTTIFSTEKISIVSLYKSSCILIMK